MLERTEWRWTFLGIESVEEGRPSQEWFDSLPDEHQGEIIAVLQYLGNVPKGLWVRPNFDPLEGAGGISEIIVPDIRGLTGVAYYRIYGYFGPGKQEYTFLHATDKKARNDKDGKAIAQRRLGELQRREAGTHKFDFETRPSKQIGKGSGDKN